ncbi:hypothetical protein CR51_18435 [Caballeronia megalochromosomata]|nr:hypothetical protein CR51_18435 [Caballeronia megalochromosomata]
MENTNVDEVYIDTLGAPMRDLIDGLHAGYAKVLRETDGNAARSGGDSETYEQLVHPQTDLLGPFSVDDFIQALESELNELRNLSPHERGQLLMLADAQRGIKDALAGRMTSAADFRQELRERARRRERARSKDRESSE